MEDNDEKRKNPRREAAEAIIDVRDVMREIIDTPKRGSDQHIDAARHAAAALDGLERAEEALGMWRDEEEEAVESLGETDENVADALDELRAAASDELLDASLDELLDAAGRSRGGGRE